MSEQAQCDPFYFKGQMAARYKERMSMGFALSDFKKGDNDTAMLESVAHETASSCGDMEFKKRPIRPPEHSRTASEQRGKSTRNFDSVQLRTSASRTSLREKDLFGSKPTMKELITQFETKTLNPDQSRRHISSEVDTKRTEKDAWETSFTEALLELGPMAAASSSLSDVEESKSSTSLSRPSNAKNSKAAISLTSDSNNENRYITLSRPPSELATDSTCEKIFQNASNSHRGCDSHTTCDKTRSDNEVGQVNTFYTTNKDNECVFNFEEGEQFSNTIDNVGGSNLPTVVNLKDSVNRQKINSANQYIVHKTDWGKRTAGRQRDTGYAALGVSTNANSSQDFPSPYDRGTNNSDGNKDLIYPLDSGRSTNFTHSPSALMKLRTRSASRQSDRINDKDKSPKEKQRARTLDRYRQSMKPAILQDFGVSSKISDNSELRKAKRPPTPHRLLNTRKGVRERGNLQHLKENSLSGSVQDVLSLKGKIDKDKKVGLGTRKNQRMKITNERKDSALDTRGGDYFNDQPLSSSNSMESSVYDYFNKVSPISRVGQPILESSDKFVGTAIIRKNIAKRAYSVEKTGSTKETLNRTSAPLHDSETVARSDRKYCSEPLRNLLSPKSQEPDEAAKNYFELEASPSTPTPAFMNRIDRLASPRNADGETEKSRNHGAHKYGDCEIGSVILTEDELADNDLIPVHLREKKKSISGNNHVIPTSSTDSCLRHSVRNASKASINRFKKSHHSPSEKRSTIAAENAPSFFEKPNSGLSPKHIKCSRESKSNRTNAGSFLERKRHVDIIKQTKHQNKGCPTETPTRNMSRETSFEETFNHKPLQSVHSKHLNILPNMHSKMGRSSDIMSTGGKRDITIPKENLTIPMYQSPKERRSNASSKESKERRHQDESSVFSELQNFNRKFDIHLAYGEGSGVKGVSSIHHRHSDLLRDSPTKKMTKNISNYPSAISEISVRENLRERKQRNYDAETGRNAQGMSENEFSLYHFGDNETRKDEMSEIESKTDKQSSLSPVKKKRKTDGTKKEKKKKSIHSHLNENVEVESLWNKSPSVTLQNTETRHSLRKDDANSVLSEKSPMLKALTATPTIIEAPSSAKMLQEEDDDKPQIKSQIPMLIINGVSPQRRLDRLIQYRRWREAMLNRPRPSRLPMSETFRKTLDNAVMEEWAMHCWHPARNMYVDTQGIWWSASFNETEFPDSAPDQFVGDGRVLSKEWVMDFTSRLPYKKFGPVRVVHASCVALCGLLFTLWNVGAKLYHCGGDEYEYYCPDDNHDCLMELFTQSSR